MALLLTAPVATAAQQAGQSSADLLQAALYEQDVRGDLEAAIRLFERILADHADDRPIAARALVELAHAHETLGNRQAVDTYRRVLSEYPDQRDVADRARLRLAVLVPAAEPAGLPADGIVARQLWSTTAGLEVNALSPDGRRVTFVDWGSVGLDGLRGHADAAVYDLATGRARVVTDRPALSEIDVYIAGAIWSPDAQRLAYTLWDTAWTHMDIYTTGADGRGNRLLVDNEQFAHVTLMEWSDAADAIAAVIQGWDDLYRIALISAHDGATRIVKTLGDHFPVNLSLSPDARFIAYEYPQEEGAAEHDLFILAADGSSEVRLAAQPADDQRPFFTPDGGHVVFMSTRSGQNALWAVPIRDGQPAGEPLLIRPDVGAAELLGFTRAGGLAYRLRRQETDVHTATLDLAGTGALNALEPITTSFVGRNLRATWSPDGERMAFLSRRGSGPGYVPYLVVRTIASGHERAHPLPFPILEQESRPVWTDDGSAVLIEGGAVGAGSASAFDRVSHRVDVETGAVREPEYRRSGTGNAAGILRFATDRQERALAEYGVRIANQRDGRLFLAGDFTVAPGQDALMLRNGLRRARGSDPADAKLLTIEGHMHAAELSPDGRTMAMSLPSDQARLMSDVLYVIPVTGGELRELARVPADHEVGVIRWLPDGAGLLYAVITEDSDEGEIRYVALDGSAPRPLDLPLTARQLGELEFHPDGRTVSLTTVTARQELWVLEGFPWQGSVTR